MEIYSVNVVEKYPVPKSQTKPFYIGTKDAPSDNVSFKSNVHVGTLPPFYGTSTLDSYGILYVMTQINN